MELFISGYYSTQHQSRRAGKHLLWSGEQFTSHLLTSARFSPVVKPYYSALIASVGTGKQYVKGRQMAAALGLTPKQHSSGDKERLSGISKRGDAYLRSLMIHGARATIWHARNKEDRLSRWVMDISKRRHPNVAAVALANKTARMA